MANNWIPKLKSTDSFAVSLFNNRSCAASNATMKIMQKCANRAMEEANKNAKERPRPSRLYHEDEGPWLRQISTTMHRVRSKNLISNWPLQPFISYLFEWRSFASSALLYDNWHQDQVLLREIISRPWFAIHSRKVCHKRPVSLH